ncbi:PAP2-like protein, putative [Hepatocystis sp. ex Piliocolobus tephrosceles]|nr:PAP2-like protein, putative [Hepatocystis sp. ex Piliocolobus tephrosceles]
MSSSSKIVKSTPCISIINYLVLIFVLIFMIKGTRSRNDNSFTYNDSVSNNRGYGITKNNLRSRKVNSLEPIYTDSALNIKYFAKSDRNYQELYKKHPLCEEKYNLVEKFRSMRIFKNQMDKSKKLVLFDTCIKEMYEILYVTISNTSNVLSIVATVYGYVPFIFIVMVVLALCVTFNKYFIYFILIFFIQTLISNIILKNIIKENRPMNSALDSYGMPSTHSAYSLCYLTFLFLHLTEGKKNKWNIITYIIATILFLPIPWSRVYIEDHTLKQALCGSIVGVCVGTILFYLKRYYVSCKKS